MKLHLFRYECKNCESVFKSPHLIGDVYGEFLMRNSKGDMVYLDAIVDKVFDEVEIIFRKIVSSEQSDNSSLFQSIFSSSCDSSSEGLDYSIQQDPICPNCKESNIGHWGPTTPPEYVEEDVNPVTHQKWNNLSGEEKELFIREAINSYLSKK